jgi:surface antigen
MIAARDAIPAGTHVHWAHEGRTVRGYVISTNQPLEDQVGSYNVRTLSGDYFVSASLVSR